MGDIQGKYKLKESESDLDIFVQEQCIIQLGNSLVGSEWHQLKNSMRNPVWRKREKNEKCYR